MSWLLFFFEQIVLGSLQWKWSFSTIFYFPYVPVGESQSHVKLIIRISVIMTTYTFSAALSSVCDYVSSLGNLSFIWGLMLHHVFYTPIVMFHRLKCSPIFPSERSLSHRCHRASLLPSCHPSLSLIIIVGLTCMHYLLMLDLLEPKSHAFFSLCVLPLDGWFLFLFFQICS